MSDSHQDRQDAAIRLLATWLAHVAAQMGVSAAKRFADEVDEILEGVPGVPEEKPVADADAKQVREANMRIYVDGSPDPVRVAAALKSELEKVAASPKKSVADFSR